MADYFESENGLNKGILTVEYVANQLNLSSGYLSDTLRSLTGQSAQQHIHYKLIEKAKEYLTTTSLSVSEIAYNLGFERSQSFNKLFKNKTEMSPLEFRQSFNWFSTTTNKGFVSGGLKCKVWAAVLQLNFSNEFGFCVSISRPNAKPQNVLAYK